MLLGSCEAKLCKHGSVCNDTDTGYGFLCYCGKYYTGRLCEKYIRCFPHARRCYVTEYKKLGVDAAGAYCKGDGNLSLPLLNGRNADGALQLYIHEDPLMQLIGGAVWLGAKADAGNRSTFPWKWLDGQRGPTSNIALHLVA